MKHERRHNINANQFITTYRRDQLNHNRINALLLTPGNTPAFYALRFRCPICDERFETVEEMLACFNQPVEKGRYKVGDIVMLSGKWMGHSVEPGDKWCAVTRPVNPRSADHFDHVNQHYYWFVITDVRNKRDDHVEVATVMSLMGGHATYGWNPTVRDSHCCMWKAGEPLVGHGGNDYWIEHFKGIEIKPPSDELKAEAALLAAEGFFTDRLI